MFEERRAVTQRRMQTTHVLEVSAVIVESRDANGDPLREVVWVDYYADGGEILSDRALVSDAAQGYQSEHDVEWIAPATPGTVRIWAVSHDNRGGMDVTSATVTVE